MSAPYDPLADCPETGPGSPARLLPRFIALVIDWLACSLIAYALLGYRWGGGGTEGFKPLIVFAIENLLLVSTIGMTLGHFVLGVVVQKPTGSAPGIVAGLVRTVLLCLVLPAVFMDSYGRGFHDKIAGTIMLRTR